jgi:hypothetical protein
VAEAIDRANIVAHALEACHRSKAWKLEEHLDSMASQVVPGTTADEVDAALQEALNQVRQHRIWQPS